MTSPSPPTMNCRLTTSQTQTNQPLEVQDAQRENPTHRNHRR
jgi:hypothetical protein